MKFDYIIANPPFKGKGDPLYMKIISTCMNYLKLKGICISLNPTVWLDSKKYKHPNPCYTKYFELPLYKMEDVSPENFNIRLATHLGIFCYSYKYDLLNIKELAWRNETNPKLAKSIYDKCCTREGIDCNIFRKSELPTKGKDFNVILAGIRGNIYDTGKHKWDWPTLLSASGHIPRLFDTQVSLLGNAAGIKPFDGEDAAYTFINYCDTDLAMYCLNLIKMNCNNNTGEWSYIPEIDYSNNDLSDSRFKKEFSLTDEEIEYIHNEMKGYGWKAHPGIRKSC